jgi:hypothetical protein
MRKSLVATLVLLAFLGGNIVSAQTPPTVWVGAGGQSCGEWVTEHEKSPKNVLPVAGVRDRDSAIAGSEERRAAAH